MADDDGMSLILLAVSLSSMSPVNLNKWPCDRVELKGQERYKLMRCCRGGYRLLERGGGGSG